MKERGPDHYSLMPFRVGLVVHGQWLLGSRHACADRRSEDDSMQFVCIAPWRKRRRNQHEKFVGDSGVLFQK
jgi:hypothetical protein